MLLNSCSEEDRNITVTKNASLLHKLRGRRILLQKRKKERSEELLALENEQVKRGKLDDGRKRKGNEADRSRRSILKKIRNRPDSVTRKEPVNLNNYFEALKLTQNSLPTKRILTGSGKKTVYECPTCQDTFTSVSHLTLHILTHSRDKPSVRHEDVSNNKPISPNSHRHVQKSDGPPSHLNLRSNVRKHKATRIGNDRIYECTKCAKTFTQKGSLTKHISTHNEIDLYECDKCEKSFTRKSSFTKHIRAHDKTVQYRCEKCDKTFIRKFSLITHMRAHEGVRNYHCEKCGKSFTRKYCLTVHFRTHDKLDLFQCDECGKKLTRKSYLTEHLRTHDHRDSFPCDTCGRMFGKKCYLINHIKTHAEKEKLQCDKCEKKFNRKSDFTRHSKTHSLPPNTTHGSNECEICQRKFKRRPGLLKHLQTHSGVKRYECSTCHKKFTFKDYLDKHMRMHSADKLHQCPTCEKKFANRSNLCKHIRTHTGNRPYECPDCQGRFTLGSGLNRHLLKAVCSVKAEENYPGKSYECKMCRKKCPSRASCIKHISIHTVSRRKSPRKTKSNQIQDAGRGNVAIR